MEYVGYLSTATVESTRVIGQPSEKLDAKESRHNHTAILDEVFVMTPIMRSRLFGR
jgi:hypothetical protein